jgi:hypothetical protein
LALVGAFSVGLAATLTAVGLALVVGRQAVERRWSGRRLALLPVLSAAALVILGLVVAGNGARGLFKHGPRAVPVAAQPSHEIGISPRSEGANHDLVQQTTPSTATPAPAKPAPVAVKCGATEPKAGAVPGEDARDGKRWVTVGQLSGACDRSSAAFHLRGIDTRLVYRSDADSFTVFLVDAKKGLDATAGYADADCAGPCSESQVLVDQAGDYFLQVHAGDAGWQVLVQEYRR